MENKGNSKTKKLLTLRRSEKVIISLIVFVLICAIPLVSYIIYNKIAYTNFWVNGQSMYPTLNLNATYDDGTLIKDRKDNDKDDIMHNLDYGYMSDSESSINNLKRFDIVVATYDQDSTIVIKRLIVLPGETFYISNEKGSNGNLYILNEENREYELISQPINSSYIVKGSYPEKYTSPTTLGDKDYFLMGDNRIEGNSLDSRTIGFINKKYLIGKAIALCGTCSVEYNMSEQEYEVYNINTTFPKYL